MLLGFKREWRIRRVLRGVARQRVAVVMQPGQVWVVEQALQRNDDTEADLATCLMRGWVETLFENLPTNDLTPDGDIPANPLFSRTETHFRLTEAGWAAINRAHAWTMVGILIAVASLLATILLAN